MVNGTTPPANEECNHSKPIFPALLIPLNDLRVDFLIARLVVEVTGDWLGDANNIGRCEETECTQGTKYNLEVGGTNHSLQACAAL